MNSKCLIFAFLHLHIGLRALRIAMRAFNDADKFDIQEVINFVKPHLSVKEITKVEDGVSQPHALENLKKELEEGGVTVIAIGDELYPPSLLALKSPPPLLYVKGDIENVQLPGIGICGSRKASIKGLKLADDFGAMTASEDTSEISGYAKGVDEKAHLGALLSGGSSVAVLAEGILRFRQKRAFKEIPDLENRMVVVSEFPPHRPWTVYNAMKRNDTILGLSKALVVVEAGAKGGTLDAGLKCLKHGKPLLVLQYKDESEMPAGNRRLIELGGVPVNTNNELRSLIRSIDPQPKVTISHKPKQASLTI